MSWTLESANNAFLEVREEAVRKREAVDALDKSRTSNHRISKKFELWKLCFYVCVTDIFFAPFVILRSLRLWNSFLRIICVEPTCQGSWHSHAKSGRVKCGPGVSRSSMDLTIWSFFSFVPPVPCHLFSFVFVCDRLDSCFVLVTRGEEECWGLSGSQQESHYEATRAADLRQRRLRHLCCFRSVLIPCRSMTRHRTTRFIKSYFSVLCRSIWVSIA